MPILNGTKSIYLNIFLEPGTLIDTDATLVGAGGVCKGHYFHAHFPPVITGKAHIIAHLELLAFIVALKAWLCPLSTLATPGTDLSMLGCEKLLTCLLCIILKSELVIFPGSLIPSQISYVTGNWGRLLKTV